MQQTSLSGLVEVLDNAAKRGFLSEPVKSRYSDNIFTQQVNFTKEETLTIREFMADNISVLRSIDYPMSDLFGDGERRTASLLSMLSYMLSSHGTDPEYVAANAKRIEDARERFGDNDFVSMMNRLTQ